MIKLIASDMDGTLLNDKMEVSNRNLQAIKDAQESGIEFLIATGRGIGEAKPFLRGKVTPGYITLNGAEVFDNKENLVSSNPISIDSKIKIVNILRTHNIYFELITNKGIFSENLDLRISSLADLLLKLNPGTTREDALKQTKEKIKGVPMTYVDSFEEILADSSYDIMKMIAYDPGEAKVLGPVMDKINNLSDVVVTSSAPNDIEINSVDAQKGMALLEYAEKRGIKQTETMAIGDNLNDASMIKSAGIGVAMKNAIPTITDMADEYTDTNVNDGVAQAIEKVIADNKKNIGQI
ncbi:Cof-type HAD-IIB family hydrolase [Companilactobacillus keshanensis]|uniref:Cof-type HAD-IIB family hydrolase n=1 Tax=Companilactobacillus keshanensis TaxID=2486003 RepID=A0ABW4BUE7_9LACO|nr:Cof-type HAD-IIB family hydrolase [Companilactobacillus keshanensis]